MVLTLDVGNSNIVMGGYCEGKIQFLSRVATNLLFEADQYAVLFRDILALHGYSGEGVEGIIISTVVPELTDGLLHAFSYISDAKPHLLTHADKGGLRIVDDSTELGMDILASAIAVYNTRPLPAIVIDMGTATKLSAIDRQGVLQGVAISPGLVVSLEALLSRASLLSGIQLESPGRALGRTSPESIKGGVIYGAADMLDGMIRRFEDELGETAACVVATGGAASLVVAHCSRDIELIDTLLLDGLYYVYTHL